MRHCLNPKNPHKNTSLSSPVSVNVNDIPGPGSEVAVEWSVSPSLQQEEQVTCQFCKYLLEGALLGDCRVTSWIGSGTFGDVYQAEQLPPLSRRVAIKVMSTEHVSDGRAAELFAREVRAIAALDHPNILPVLRVGTLTEGRPYLVMKYAAHGSLQKFCPALLPPYSILPTAIQGSQEYQQQEQTNHIQETASSLSAQETLVIEDETLTSEVALDEKEDSIQSAVAAQVAIKAVEATVLTPQQLLPYLEGAAAALQYAHDNGIIHLDVKPANLLLDGADRLLLADFGVSALLEGYTHASLHGYVGTPLYTAPEQWLEQPRAASDQYALAVTCYQLLTGHAPFTGNLYSIMHGHIETAPPPLREFQPLIPEEVEAVILHALAKEPTNRYKDILTFAHTYRAALASSASAQTNSHEQRHVTEALPHEVERNADVEEAQTKVLTPAQFATTVREPVTRQEEQAKKALQLQSQSSMGIDQPVLEALKQASKAELEGEKIHSSKRNPWRAGILVLLIILLIASSALGVTWFANPCLLGMCPAMVVNTKSVQFTGSGTRQVEITNPGTADLHWSISSNATWLYLSPLSGTIHPGKTSSFTITSDTSGLSHDVTVQAYLQVIGIGVLTQSISVTMQFLSGLNNVTIQGTLKDFTLNQGLLQPATQKITLTNNSGETISWLASFSENTWLVVTPNQDNALQNGKSDVLTITANTQNLTPDTYVANLQVLGSLSRHPGLELLKSYAITLHSSPSLSTPTTSTPISPVTPTPTPGFQFRTFSAQAAHSTDGPAALRSGHAMVWNGHTNLFVFGGIDSHGNVLNDLWEYNTGTDIWTELSPPTALSTSANCGMVPAPRMNAAVVWDSVDQKLLLYGGLGASNTYLGDLWSFDPSKPGWTLLQCSGNNPGFRSSNAVWDGQHMLLLGGKNAGGLLKDFWSYTPGIGWQQLADAAMGPRAFQTMVWDTTASRLYVFGGLDVNGLQQDDFWMYSSSSNWVRVTPSSSGVGTGRPAGRQEAFGAWDSKDNLMLLMGGWEAGQGVPYYGVWAYDPNQNAWELVTPDYPGNSSNPGPHIIPGRTASAIVWDAAHQRAYIYAGNSSYQSRNNLNDLWILY